MEPVLTTLHEVTKAPRDGLSISREAGVSELPLVSVITAVYNGRAELGRCIESVLSQDYPNIEHIIVDGGSTDGTVELLKAYGDRIAHWTSEPDAGVFDAWNKGLDIAQGEWISFLGSDDIYLPGAVRGYMNAARENPGVHFLSSRIDWVHHTGYRRVRGEPWVWPRFSRLMCTAHPGSMHSRKLFEQYGRYDTAYRSAADYELLLRAGGNLRAGFYPATTVEMRSGGLSDSIEALREAMRAKVKTAGRSQALADAEFCIAVLKLRFRGMLFRLDRALR